MRSNYFFFFILTLLFSLNAYAAELRIVDSRDLTMAIAQVEERGSVIVKVSDYKPGSTIKNTELIVQNINGLHETIRLDIVDKAIVVKDIPAGNWKVMVSPPLRKVVAVSFQ